ncbi:Conserved_hypothetical protein [Hexamita inflata]|uniref:Uncharacterized protein n=1 Tax=Hexamita inflata TaxID=28002 RepID=A0AA86NWC6_9EUKA|nr:Conserved hypothetical protein [Hexamita inflata]
MTQNPIQAMNEAKQRLRQIAENNALNAKIAQMQRIIDLQNEKIQNLELIINQFTTQPEKRFGPIMKYAVDRYLYFKENKKSQWHIQQEKEFWIAVKIQSPQTYVMLRTQFNLYHPVCMNCLKRIYQKAHGITDSIFSSTFQAEPQFLSQYAKKLKASGAHTVYVGLSSDFCYFNVQSYEDENGSKVNYSEATHGKHKGQLLPTRAACAFTVCPYDRDLPKTLIYFKPTVDGPADDTIYQAMKDIRETLKQYHISAQTFSVDGESYYNRYKRKQFEQVYSQYLLGSVSCHDYLSDQKEHLFQPDWLHEQKLMRYKYLQKTLELCKEHDSLNLYGIQSTPTENEFSGLRTSSNYQNNINMAKVVVKNRRTLEMIEFENQFELHSEGNRVGRHQTTTHDTRQNLNFEEETKMKELAQDAVDLIFNNVKGMTKQKSLLHEQKYLRLKNFWNEVYNLISNEHFYSAMDERTKPGLYTHNGTQQANQQRMAGQKQYKQEIVGYRKQQGK